MLKFMKKSLSILSLLTVSLLVASTSYAADKEVTLKGKGTCAKCDLGETKTCQNVVVVKEGDKSVTYYIDQNAVSKAFHKEICTDAKTISVVGTVKEEGGKKMLVASKIEAAK